MLKIIVVNDFAFVNGGAAQVALDSAVALAERGHSVTLFASVGPPSDEVLRSLVNLSITAQHEIKTDPSRLRAAKQGIWNQLAARQFSTLISNCDPSSTIIHLHGWTKALSSSIIRAALKKDFEVVVTLHDYFVACPNGGFYNFRKGNVCHLNPLSLKCIAENCDRDGYPEKLWRVGRQVVQNQFGFMRGRVKHFITLSDFSEGILRRSLPSDADVYRISPPIFVTRGIPADVAKNSAFTAVGRMSPEKGLSLMARAACSLNCEMVCVGDGPERSDVTRIYPTAIVTGWQSKAQVADHLRSARALVFPSIWYEAQPAVILEAAALGVPAIVSDACAGRDMVLDGVTGLWFRSGDVEDLRRKMRQLMDPCEAARLGREAFAAYWSNPRTLEKHVDALENCYLKILRKDQGIPAYEEPVSV